MSRDGNSGKGKQVAGTLFNNPGNTDHPSNNSFQIEHLRTKFRVSKEKLQRHYTSNNSGQKQTFLDINQARDMLSMGTTLLIYSVLEEETALFVTSKTETLKIIRVPYKKAQLEQIIRDLQREFYPNISNKMAMDALSRELFEVLIRPAYSEIEKAKRRIIIPDGPLFKLPFNLLLENGAKPRYLIEWKPITTAVSAAMYARQKARKAKPIKQIVAFGDANFPRSPMTNGDTRDPHIRSLLRNNPFKLKKRPHTLSEVKSIADLFPQETTLFLNEDASEANLKKLATKTDILHLALHGWMNDRVPMESALAFSINPDFKEGEENGILQTWEIFDLDLDVELLVLSACQSALGQVKGGEGMMGLTRAFQYAGARSILASYWNVEDEATAVLMKRFYTHLKAGLPKDEAIRQAQIDMIRNPVAKEEPGFFGVFKKTIKKDYSHPFYWAGFQLIGPN